MKIFLRIVNVIAASVCANFVFKKIYDEYYSYLPDYEKLKTLNNETGIGAVLRENSMGLRDLYNHALERSILYSFISFVLIIIVLEYISFGVLLQKYFSSGKKNI